MNRKVILIILSIFALFNALEHKCSHNEVASTIENPPIKVDLDLHSRNLQAVSPRPMKITYDMTNLNSSGASTALKTTIEKALKAALSYFSKLIAIIPKTGQMSWNLPSTTCGPVTIPLADRQTSKDSDLHLYISSTNDPTAAYLSYAGWCRFILGLGPTHGLINFNIGRLGAYNYTDPAQFQRLVEVTIHEGLHVLGFTSNTMPYWVDSNKNPQPSVLINQMVRGISSFYLATPNVLAYGRSYYACPTLAGVPLENQGGSGSAISHWEQTILNGELLDAILPNSIPILSAFTAAALKDTGFYASIDSTMVEPYSYGKGGGCAFVTGTCDPLSKAFCPATETTLRCDIAEASVSTCTTSSFMDSTCRYRAALQQGRCFSAVGNVWASASSVEGTSFGYKSKCFVSSLTTSKQLKFIFICIEEVNLSFKSIRIAKPLAGKCFNYSCNAANQITIFIGTSSLTCSLNGQILSFSTGWTGQIMCPSNLEQFCNTKKVCPNLCSSNGYCINGVCECSTGYSGIDCRVATVA